MVGVGGSGPMGRVAGAKGTRRLGCKDPLIKKAQKAGGAGIAGRGAPASAHAGAPLPPASHPSTTALQTRVGTRAPA